MAALDLVVDHLHQHRRGRHGIAVHHAHIPAQVAGITAEIQGPALYAIDKVADETGQMEHGHQRKVAEVLVEILGCQPLLLVKDVLLAIDVHLAGGEVVLLAQHHALAAAGGAGGEHQHQQILVVDAVDHLSLRGSGPGIHGAELSAVERFQLGAVAVIDAIIEDEVRLHHAQLMLQLGPGLALVQGHDDSACHHGAENDSAVLIVGAAQDDDLLALGLAQLLLQAAGHFADILHILSVGLFHHRVLALHIAERHTVSILILHRRDHVKNGHRHICHGHNFLTSLVFHYFTLPVYFC